MRPRDANDQWQWIKWTMELLFSLTTTMEEIPSKTRIERLSTYQHTVNNFLSSSLGYYIVEICVKLATIMLPCHCPRILHPQKKEAILSVSDINRATLLTPKYSTKIVTVKSTIDYFLFKKDMR